MVWPRLEPMTSAYRSRCATTESNLLGSWILILYYLFRSDELHRHFRTHTGTNTIFYDFFLRTQVFLYLTNRDYMTLFFLAHSFMNRFRYKKKKKYEYWQYKDVNFSLNEVWPKRSLKVTKDHLLFQYNLFYKIFFV